MTAYAFTNLIDPAEGETYTVAGGLNSSGQVLGSYAGAVGFEGFIYDPVTGAYTNLIDPAQEMQYGSTNPASINDAGLVVGSFSLAGAFGASPTEGFIYNPGTGLYTTLTDPAQGTFGGTTSALAINDSGQVVGYYNNFSTYGGFIYNSSTGAYTNLTDPAQGAFGGATFANAINDAGQVVGYYEQVNNSTGGFIYDPSTGTYTNLIDPAQGASGNTYATAINDAGQVLGYFTNGVATESFIYNQSTGAYTNLVDPEQGANGATYALSINSAGQVAGYFTSGTATEGFIYDPVTGTYTNLSDPAQDANGATVIGSINSAGQVSGYVFNATTNTYEGFVASPVSAVVTAPTISGTVGGQTTTLAASVNPFSGVTIADANANATDTLTITISGAGGTLSGAGLSGSNGIYRLTGTAATVTTELDALSFTPNGDLPGTDATTIFTLFDLSSADATPAVDSATTVTEHDPQAQLIVNGGSASPIGVVNAGAVSFSITGLNSTCNGSVTFSDGNPAQNVTVQIVSGVPQATSVNLKGMAGELVTSTLALNPDAAGNTFQPISGNAVRIDPGPTSGPVNATVDLGQTVDLTSLILNAATPGLPGDKLTITADGVAGALGSVALSNGDLTYTAGSGAFPHIPANGTATDQFSYTIADQYGDVTTGTVDITVSNPATAIFGPKGGGGTIKGGSGTNVVTAYGARNTIIETGGNDIVNAGSGQATVQTGSGDVVVNLNGSSDKVSGGNGNDTVSGSAGNANIVLGDGADSVSAGGVGNIITLGNGNDVVSGGTGSIINVGNGADQITATGSIVHTGNGNDDVTGSGNIVVAANGDDQTTVTGSGNIILTNPAGADAITLIGSGNAVLSGNGADTITVAGSGNIVDCGGGANTITVTGSWNMVNVAIGADTVYLAGNSEHISLLGGPSAHIYDQGSNMSVDVFGSAGTDVISGFANDPTGVIDLLSGSGGFSSVGQVLKALHSDGNGGTLLSLGHSGSIDFLGVAPAQLHASNFRIG